MSKLSANLAGRRMQVPGAAGAAFTHYEMMIPLERTRQQFQASAALLQMDDGRVALLVLRLIAPQGASGTGGVETIRSYI
jgi:hypothetical protein